MDNLVQIPQNLTIMQTQEAVEFFLNNQTKGTAATYGISIRKFFAWAKGISYRDVTPFMALSYNEYLKQHDAPATVQNKISALNRFFTFAVKLKLIEDNPFSIVKQKGVPNRANEKFLTVKELDKLLTALYDHKKPQRYVAGLLLASFGPRISEVVGLNHCDFIELPDGGIGVHLHRKGDEYQLIPIREDVWEIVKEYMGHEPNAFDKRPLLVNPSGNRITPESLRNWITEAAKKAGIKKDITVHWLRHSAATHLLDRGESLENVRWLLGHKSIRTTALYTHPTNKRIAESMPIKVKTADAPE